MKEVILDTIIDSLKLIPFLLVAFLIIESICLYKSLAPASLV